MSEPKRFDPIVFHDQGGSSYGQVKEGSDGDYVLYEDYQKLRAEKEQAEKILSELMPFVFEDYYPNCATPEFKAAVEAAKDWLQCNSLSDTTASYIHRDKVREVLHKIIKASCVSESEFLSATKDQLTKIAAEQSIQMRLIAEEALSAFDNGGGV